MRKPIAVASFLTLLITGSAAAEVVTAPQAAVETISTLEKKFFAHIYDSHLTERVGRLERFVFGEARNNFPLTQRIARLTQTAGVLHGQPTEPPLGSRTSVNTANKTAAQKPPVQSSYPRVTNLERKILGSTFDQQPLMDRLNRLECKVFGHASSVQDFARRVDAVEQEAFFPVHAPTPGSLISTRSPGEPTQRFSESQYPQFPHLQAVQQNYAASNSNRDHFGVQQYTTGQKNFVSVVDQIEFLEMTAFGRIRPNKRLEDRVEALEKNFHRQTEANETLTNRVARIWSVAFERQTRSYPYLIR